MASFSKELVEQLIEYFTTKYDIKLTSEQAEDFLSSLAEFYLAMSEDERDCPAE